MKVTTRENVRVEALPHYGWRSASVSNTEWEMLCMREAETLAAAIRRHCDQDAVIVTYDTVSRCSHCGYVWEDALDEEGRPICCAAAVDEWEREK